MRLMNNTYRFLIFITLFLVQLQRVPHPFLRVHRDRGILGMVGNRGGYRPRGIIRLRLHPNRNPAIVGLSLFLF